MKATEFADKILRGKLFEAMGNPDLQFVHSVVKACASAGALLLCVHTLCGCTRVLYYEVDNIELVTKASGELHYEMRTKCSVCFPKATECIPRTVLPNEWASLPMLNAKVNYAHAALDTALHECLVMQEAKGL
jgi:hypothetical protein